MKRTALLLLSMRPKQWTKNVLLFGGIVFSRHLFEADSFVRALLGFFVFCVLSGFVYVLNDVTDVEKDKKHPEKQDRPIASGALAPAFALPASAVLAALALLVAFYLSPGFGLVSLLYVVIQVLYSYVLKNLVMLDILTISAGFVIRALAGAIVIDVEFSSWLIACTIFLSLFLAIAKRRHELVTLGDNAIAHRFILQEYTPQLLDQMISIVTASTIMAYTLYTMSPETAKKFGTQYLYVTVPFVLYGLLRYLYLVYCREMGGSPAQILLEDTPLIIDILLWIACILILVYWPNIYALLR